MQKLLQYTHQKIKEAHLHAKHFSRRSENESKEPSSNLVPPEWSRVFSTVWRVSNSMRK